MGCRVLARDLDERAREKLVAEMDASELGLVAFARSRGVNPSTLCRWAQRYRRGHPLVSGPQSEIGEREGGGLGFAEVVVGGEVPVRHAPVVVQLPLGVRVEIPADLVEGALRRLLVLDARC